MNRPAKLGKKAPAKNPGALISRNPLKELNNGDLPPRQSIRGSKGGCFGFLLPNSSSSSSVSSAASSSRQRSHHGTPKSVRQSSRHLRAPSNRGDAAGLRSRATQEKISKEERHSCGNQKQSRSDEQHKSINRSVPQQRIPGRSGSDRLPLQKKDAEGRGRNAAVGKPKDASFGVGLEGNNAAPKLYVSRGSGALPDLISEGRQGFDLEDGGVPLNELPHGPVLDATPGKEGEQQQQLSHTPTSTRTATPPVQVSISPELGAQSAIPTPACFAAGHLIAGVQDRRKCRPRGILNGGRVEIAEGRGLGSFDARGNGCCGTSLTPPPPLEASVHWLSSPCGGESGNLRSSAVSSSNRKVYMGIYPLEASMNWFLSPLEDETDACVLEDVPSGATEATGDSPGFRSLVGMNSSNFENTPSAVEICCSPTTNSSVSPFSMIIKKAAGSARCKDHNLQDKGKHRYGSSIRISPFSGDSHGSSNVIRTPSSCSCSSRQVGPVSTFDLHAMGEAVETTKSSSPLWKLLASESEDLLSLSPPRFQSGCPPTPSNSISLACFRRPWCHQSSVEEEFCTKERISSSETRISWREGLISRIFEMDEFNQNPWPSNKGNADCHGEDELNLRRDTKFDQNIGSSVIKEVSDQFRTNGLGSFEFVGHRQTEEQSETKHSSSIHISCAESLNMHVDGLMDSDDSDWTLFFKNNLFEI